MANGLESIRQFSQTGGGQRLGRGLTTLFSGDAGAFDQRKAQRLKNEAFQSEIAAAPAKQEAEQARSAKEDQLLDIKINLETEASKLAADQGKLRRSIPRLKILSQARSPEEALASLETARTLLPEIEGVEDIEDTDEAIELIKAGRFNEVKQSSNLLLNTLPSFGVDVEKELSAPKQTSLQEKRALAKEANALRDTGDPAKIREADQIEQFIGSAPKGPSVEVNVNPDGTAKSEERLVKEARAEALKESIVTSAKERSKRLWKTGGPVDTIDQNSINARQLQGEVDVLRRIGEETEPGLFAPFLNGFGRVMKAFNVNDKVIKSITDQDVKSNQQFNSISKRMVNAVLQQAQGVQTDGDARRAEVTLGSLGNEKEANKFIASHLTAVNDRTTKKKEMMDDRILAMRDEGLPFNDDAFREFEKEWNTFVDSTPIISSDPDLITEDGTPMFFWQYKKQAKETGLTDQEILRDWRLVNNE